MAGAAGSTPRWKDPLERRNSLLVSQSDVYGWKRARHGLAAKQQTALNWALQLFISIFDLPLSGTILGMPAKVGKYRAVWEWSQTQRWSEIDWNGLEKNRTTLLSRISWLCERNLPVNNWGCFQEIKKLCKRHTKAILILCRANMFKFFSMSFSSYIQPLRYQFLVGIYPKSLTQNKSMFGISGSQVPKPVSSTSAQIHVQKVLT